MIAQLGLKLVATGLLVTTFAWAWAVFTDTAGSVADIYGKYIAIAGLVVAGFGAMIAVWAA